MLLSLFCGAGGLDLGFEKAGFTVGLAFDIRQDSIDSYNHNRTSSKVGIAADIRTLTPARMDQYNGAPFHPKGVIGGPPCQSFSRANVSVDDDDPRHDLPITYAQLILSMNSRSPVDFFVFENVTGLQSGKHLHRYSALKKKLSPVYHLSEAVLNAAWYLTPQNRERIFLVGVNKSRFPGIEWTPPDPTTTENSDISVKSAIYKLPIPVFWKRGLNPDSFPLHRNHWCMTPKSAKFTKPGALKAGDGKNRSFKTLSWERPSITVAYGHREVHIHPDCQRRLSVYEAMKLQGFPHSYELLGSLSSQITQVSEAVPPPMAEAVAVSVKRLLYSSSSVIERDAA